MPSAYRIFRIKAPVLGMVKNAGTTDLDPRAWLTAKNVQMVDREVRKVYGWARVKEDGGSNLALTGRVNMIDTIKWPNGTEEGVVGTEDYIYSFNTGTNAVAALNGVAYTGGVRNRWSHDVYLDTAVFTNYADAPQKWVNSAASTAALGGTPPKAKTLAVSENHLLLGNLYVGAADSPYSIANSDLGDIEMWTTTDPNVESAIFPVTEGWGAVQRILKLGNTAVAYKERGISMLSYVNPDLVFYLQTVVTNQGPPSGWSVVDIGGEHVFIGQDGIYRFNGNSQPVSFGDRVYNWFQTSLYRSAQDIVWGFHHRKRKEVIWGFRNGADTDNWALVYNYETDSFTERQWPFYAAGYLRLSRAEFAETWNEQGSTSWDNKGGTWDEMLAQSVQDYDLVAGDGSGYLWDADNLLYEQANGVDIEATLESKDFDFDAPDRVKQIGGILLDAPQDTGTNPLTLEVGTRDNLNDDITWTSPRSYSGNGRIDVRAAGRYIRFRFKKNGGHFRMREWAPLYQVRGNY